MDNCNTMNTEFVERMEKHGKVLVRGTPPNVNLRRNIENPFIRYTFRILTVVLLSIILIFNVWYISKARNPVSNADAEGIGTVSVERNRSFKISNKEYHFFTDVEVNWAQALQFCLAHGFDLADIPTRAHDEAIKNFIVKACFTMPFWVGGLGFGNGEFFWIKNGRMLGESYNGWQHSQPDNFGSELCLEINFNSAWNNRDCNHKEHVDEKIGILCQKEIN